MRSMWGRRKHSTKPRSTVRVHSDAAISPGVEARIEQIVKEQAAEAAVLEAEILREIDVAVNEHLITEAGRAPALDLPAGSPVTKRRNSNPPTPEQLAAELKPIDLDLELDEQIEVAGETYYIKGIKKLFRHHGMPITTKGSTLDDAECILVPEPWNEHDPNAVAVIVTSWLVGYVPADMAPGYAAPLQKFAAKGYAIRGRARVWAQADSGAGTVRARVTILVPEADLLPVP